jgi:tetratricopeptide (TPR) repeat protein
MRLWSGVERPLRSLLLLTLLFAAVAPSAFAQGFGAPGAGRSGQVSLTDVPTTLLVSVREMNGMPLAVSAFVKLSSSFTGLHLTSATQTGSSATFPNLRAGDYEVEVTSAGYKTATEQTSIFGAGSTDTVYVYMHPVGEPSTANPRGGPVMTPRLQNEIDKGLDKMRRQQYDAARGHFDKAAKIAPGNPDVQYLLGQLEYNQQHFDLARTRFEAAISLYPSHERSLVALGELQLRAGQPDQATQTLEKAYLINGADSRTHLLLAYAYAGQKDFEKARSHAARAAELSKERAAPARLLLGRILAAQGKTAEAKTALEAVIRDFPNDPPAQEAKAQLAEIDKRAAATLAAAKAEAVVPPAPPAPSALPPAAPALIRPWAPPDVDAKEYLMAPDVACSQDQVLQRTQLRTSKQLANLEKFMATEHIEHQEIDNYGNPGPVKAKDFTYLVFIQHPKKAPFFLEEQRDGGENLGSFPTGLASRGLVGLGVMLFHPDYEGDLNYKCEGLGEWRGQAAWQIRFEQRKEVDSRLMTWRNNRGLFPVALKGRVWVAANTYDVLHIETDLREPLNELELSRDHLVIDYGPVQFQHANTSLWLPWYAELYMELHGKRYHHKHVLTNYALFAVDTNHQVSAPKEK